MEKAGKDIEDEDLAEAMAGKGLGTPATRADTIEKLLSRGYISRQQSGALNATPHGIRIIELLRRIPVEWIASPELTGEMEASLTAVQQGELKASEYMEKIVQQTRELVERIRDHDRSKLFENDESIGTCPLCGSKVIETRCHTHARTTKEKTRDAHSYYGKIPVGAGLIDKLQQNCWKNERSMTCTDSLIETVKLTKLRLSFPMKAKSHQRNPPVTGRIQPMKRWLHVLHATEQSVKQIRTMPATKMGVSLQV